MAFVVMLAPFAVLGMITYKAIADGTAYCTVAAAILFIIVTLF